MNALQAVSKALQRKLSAFQKDPMNENEEMLHGAALLAIDVGIIMNSPALMTEAQQVIRWIEQWTLDQEMAYAVEMEESHAAWKQRQEPTGEAWRFADAIVGREYNDPMWIRLVDAYREAFPTFIVRNFVFARLDPAQMSFRLRQLLTKVFEEKKLGRIPTETEMRDFLPEAKARLQVQTLTYLERSLPGYDFQGHAILKQAGS